MLLKFFVIVYMIPKLKPGNNTKNCVFIIIFKCIKPPENVAARLKKNLKFRENPYVRTRRGPPPSAYKIVRNFRGPPPLCTRTDFMDGS